MEQQEHDILEELIHWTEQERHYRLDANSWSAIEVVDHLVKVEYASLAAIRARLPRGQPISIQEKIGTQLVLAVMRSRIRIKVPPSVLSVLPDKAPRESEIVDRWEELRKEMKALLSSLQPEQLSGGLFLHPVSGSMTIIDAMTFLSAHMKHHCHQLCRIRRSRGQLRPSQ